MLKKTTLFLLGFIFSVTIWAANGPVLVLDAANEPGLPSNFRTTSDPLPSNPTISYQGLAKLHALGSAQFSALGLMAVLDKIKAPILIVDLRQESHGFIDGNAVSWYGPRDWANLGRSSIQVEADQQDRLKALNEKEKITVNKITDKDNEGQVTRVKPIVLTINNVMSELEMAALHQVGYVRIYVTDHIVPNNSQVDRFIQLVRSLSSRTWLYFHCRAGKGRTTTFMVMYDMMRNAKTVSFLDIMQRQHLLGGIDLEKLPERTSYKNTLVTQREEFLQRFYLYCKANQDDFATSWTAWKQANNVVKLG